MSAISAASTAQSFTAPQVISPPRQPVQNAGPSDTGKPTPSFAITGRVVNITT